MELKEFLEQNTFKLDPEKKKVWVENLTNGKYQQGHSALVTTENEYGDNENEIVGQRKYYCCLGVYAELNNIQSYHQGFLKSKTNDFASSSYDYLPEWFQKLMSTLNDGGGSSDVRLDDKLIFVNIPLSPSGNPKYTFTEIAYIIEKYF